MIGIILMFPTRLLKSKSSRTNKVLKCRLIPSSVRALSLVMFAHYRSFSNISICYLIENVWVCKNDLLAGSSFQHLFAMFLPRKVVTFLICHYFCSQVLYNTRVQMRGFRERFFLKPVKQKCSRETKVFMRLHSII